MNNNIEHFGSILFLVFVTLCFIIHICFIIHKALADYNKAKELKPEDSHCGCSNCTRCREYFEKLNKYNMSKEDKEYFENFYILLDNTELDRDWSEMDLRVYSGLLKDLAKKYNIPESELMNSQNRNIFREKYFQKDIKEDLNEEN